MKSLILFSIFAIGLSGLSEQTIEDASLKFKIDEYNWKLALNNQNDNYTTFIYKRKVITDSNGLKVIPSFSIILEPIIPNSNVIVYSAQKRIKVPFEVKKVISYESGHLSLKNAVGYFGTYLDKNELVHKVYVVHAICGEKGIQIIGDITQSVEDKMEDEMLNILKSVEYYGNE